MQILHRMRLAIMTKCPRILRSLWLHMSNAMPLHHTCLTKLWLNRWQWMWCPTLLTRLGPQWYFSPLHWRNPCAENTMPPWITLKRQLVSKLEGFYPTCSSSALLRTGHIGVIDAKTERVSTLNNCTDTIESPELAACLFIVLQCVYILHSRTMLVHRVNWLFLCKRPYIMSKNKTSGLISPRTRRSNTDKRKSLFLGLVNAGIYSTTPTKAIIFQAPFQNSSWKHFLSLVSGGHFRHTKCVHNTQNQLTWRPPAWFSLCTSTTWLAEKWVWRLKKWTRMLRIKSVWSHKRSLFINALWEARYYHLETFFLDPLFSQSGSKGGGGWTHFGKNGQWPSLII